MSQQQNSNEIGNIELEREKSVNVVKPVDQTTKRQSSKGRPLGVCVYGRS